MANWVNKVDFKFVNELEAEDYKAASRLAVKEMNRLLEVYKVPPNAVYAEEELKRDLERLEDIRDWFEYVEDLDDFNNTLSELYDFGDESYHVPGTDFFNNMKKLWVVTF